MKITKKQLREIIKEELLKEESSDITDQEYFNELDSLINYIETSNP